MILHASDLENVNNWIKENSLDPLQADLTETVSKRESVFLLLSMLDCFYPYICLLYTSDAADE